MPLRPKGVRDNWDLSAEDLPAARDTIATSPQAQGGAYYGPDKPSETRGYPAVARIPPQALDTSVAARLWIEWEGLAKVVFR